jgi:hypothetical protein
MQWIRLFFLLVGISILLDGLNPIPEPAIGTMDGRPAPTSGSLPLTSNKPLVLAVFTGIEFSTSGTAPSNGL